MWVVDNVLRPDAYNFAKVVSDLWLMEEICLWSRKGQMDQRQLLETHAQILEVSNQLVSICENLGIERNLMADIERLRSEVRANNLDTAAGSCSALRDRVVSELKTELYLHIPNRDRDYFGMRSPFGEVVSKKFKKSVDDFAHAADCLALQQPTASVFHLMRGVEVAVQYLAKKLRMTLSETSTWRQITGAMDARITAMPHATTKERLKKDEWRDARINLDILGSVVRNKTMHAASVYTQDEARHIFGNVSEVMTRLCKL